MSETRDAGTSPPATSDAGSKARDESGKAAAERGVRPTAGAAKAGGKAIAAARSAAGKLTSAPAPAASTGIDSRARVNRTLRRATLRVRRFSRRRALPRIRRLAALIASRLNPRNLERDYRRLLAGVHALLLDRAEESLYFVPTRGHVAKSRLTIPSRVREEARDYRPTPVRLFRWAMSVLPKERLQDMTFVDYGAGRGRVLLMASHYPFEQIRGAEIAAELHDDCLMNVAQYPRSLMKCRDIECRHARATTLPTPEEPAVFYFFDPFSIGQFEKVLARLTRAYKRNRRQMYLICVGMEEGEAVAKTGIFHPLPQPLRQRIKLALFSPYSLRIYRTEP